MKLDELLAQCQEKEEIIPTGLASLDDVIGGLRIGQIHTVAGRPGMGKTMVLLSIARNICMLNKVPTAIITFGLSEKLIVDRLFSVDMGMELFDLKKSIGTPIRDERMKKAVAMFANTSGFKSIELEKEACLQRMKDAPLWVEQAMDFTVDEVISRIERMKEEENIKVFMIDDLSWLLTGQNNNERETSMLKLFQTAQRLKIAILVTTGVGRAVEFRNCKIPSLADIKGGSCMETYSSVVMILYRPEYYGIAKDDFVGGDTKGLAILYVSKNNNGYCGWPHLKFVNHSRFEDYDEFGKIADTDFEIISPDVPMDVKSDEDKLPDLPF